MLELREECAKPKNEEVVVCSLLSNLPGLPDLPGLGGIELPILGDLFGGTSGGQGLPRTAPGGGAEPTGPQVSELASLYDADLVGLMIPGMVVS